MSRKNVKITKRAHAFKGYASTYNVKILNSFNSKPQLKDTEDTEYTKDTELREFKSVTTLVLVLKVKIESEDKTKHDTFHLH